MLYDLFQEYCRKSEGVYFFGVGGTETHVHLLVQAEPTVRPSEFAGRIKGFSAHELNERMGMKALKWQRGYGIVSFAKKNLPGLSSYVERQKEHHAAGTTNEILGRWFPDAEEPEEEEDA